MLPGSLAVAPEPGAVSRPRPICPPHTFGGDASGTGTRSDLWTRAVGQIVDAEIDRHYRPRPRTFFGVVERGDLESAGWLGALRGVERLGPSAPMAYLRVCIRGAIGDELRREWRAQGRVRRTIRWPWYWPGPQPDGPHLIGLRRLERGSAYQHTPIHAAPSRPVRHCADCPARLESPWAKRCPDCAAHRRLLRQRVHNATYTARRRQLEEAVA